MRDVGGRGMRFGDIDEFNVLPSDAAVFYRRSVHIAVLEVGGPLEVWIRDGKVGNFVLYTVNIHHEDTERKWRRTCSGSNAHSVFSCRSSFALRANQSRLLFLLNG